RRFRSRGAGRRDRRGAPVSEPISVSRRAFLDRLAPPSSAAREAARDRQDRLDAQAPLTIRTVEAVVIRTPNDKPIPFDEPIDLPPVGDLTGGTGIWNRLDHASPTRFKGYEQAVLVKITTAGGLVGWGECHAPSAPRMHQTIISDLFAPILRGKDAPHITA